MGTMTAAITINNLAVHYGKHVALHDIHAVFEAGSLTAMAGPNGAGKSTLLKTIAGIVRPKRGSVTINPALESSIAYMPQLTSIQRDFPISVLKATCTGFWPRIGNTGAITRAMQQQALTALADVGLADYAERQIDCLSGGQFQRLLFARLIIQDPRLILLDEPFTAVDAGTTARLIRIMLQWHQEGRTIICVLHDLLLIRKYFPESFVLAGKCLGRGHTHKLFEQKLLSFDLDMAELHTGTNDTHGHQHEGHGHHYDRS
ncbi:MAG: ATP-binding cassette domain-containing protein [Alphaproteobacteria bacterium]|nr:ATP-binding cassette domain-containing protein [Alphaproteobacteria bacterium]